MYRQQISRKYSPSSKLTNGSKKQPPTRSYGTLSSVVQRAQQDPSSLSGDEWRQLDSAIGTRAVREIKAGKQTPWIPEFVGISAQLWGDTGQKVPPIQTKLTIGEVGDKYEQEADRVAKEVVQQINRPAPVAQGKDESVPGKERNMVGELSMKPMPARREREAMEEEGESIKMKPMVQRVGAIGGVEASTDVEAEIDRARGGGQPLERDLQQSMGKAMGADFSGVRVHTDERADRLNQALSSRAFTTGRDLFFKKWEYQPGSREGQGMIAHELTHVMQQKKRSQDTDESLIQCNPRKKKKYKKLEEGKKRKNRRTKEAFFGQTTDRVDRANTVKEMAEKLDSMTELEFMEYIAENLGNFDPSQVISILTTLRNLKKYRENETIRKVIDRLLCDIDEKQGEPIFRDPLLGITEYEMQNWEQIETKDTEEEEKLSHEERVQRVAYYAHRKRTTKKRRLLTNIAGGALGAAGVVLSATGGGIVIGAPLIAAGVGLGGSTKVERIGKAAWKKKQGTKGKKRREVATELYNLAQEEVNREEIAGQPAIELIVRLGVYNNEQEVMWSLEREDAIVVIERIEKKLKS